MQRKIKGKRHIQLGATSELVVATDLLKRGYHVYRSLASASPFDLIAYKNGSSIKIEVKTSRLLKNGAYQIISHPHSEHDILALVVDGVIVYRPALPESGM